MKLHEEIRDFLSKHAGIRPDYDPEIDDEIEKYTSPDAITLHYVADEIESGRYPVRVWSEWGSGGYHPYTNKKAMMWHNSILARVLWRAKKEETKKEGK